MHENIKRLAADGMAVGVLDLKEDDGARTVGEIEEAGGKAIAVIAKASADQKRYIGDEFTPGSLVYRAAHLPKGKAKFEKGADNQQLSGLPGGKHPIPLCHQVLNPELPNQLPDRTSIGTGLL